MSRAPATPLWVWWLQWWTIALVWLVLVGTGVLAVLDAFLWEQDPRSLIVAPIVWGMATFFTVVFGRGVVYEIKHHPDYRKEPKP